jgi:hypothetical protein
MIVQLRIDRYRCDVYGSWKLRHVRERPPGCPAGTWDPGYLGKVDNAIPAFDSWLAHRFIILPD